MACGESSVSFSTRSGSTRCAGLAHHAERFVGRFAESVGHELQFCVVDVAFEHLEVEFWRLVRVRRRVGHEHPRRVCERGAARSIGVRV